MGLSEDEVFPAVEKYKYLGQDNEEIGRQRHGSWGGIVELEESSRGGMMDSCMIRLPSNTW